MTIERAFEIIPELPEMYKKEPEVKEIIDTARKIEGCARHVSVHAAGVVISPTPLTDFVPLQFDPKGEGKIITQYDMYSVEEAGLLKFDFLGIKNLSILADAIDRVSKIENVKVDLDNLPLNDKKTFDMLAKGETIGLFQLNGSGMTRYLKDLRPSSIHDINAMVALYRPGPMESIPQYIERKHNPRLVQYLDPRMKEILSASYGVLTYQDDVLLIAIKLAGYSWIEADKLRKAMGKKIPAEMEAQKEKLIAGCIKNGLSKEKAEKLWGLIEPFAAYGFNKCLTGDTLITDTKNGQRMSIKEIYENNKSILVSSVDDKGKLTSQKVSAVMQNGVKRIYRLKTKTGREIRATSNHPVCTFEGWKNLSQIIGGDRIAVARIIHTGSLKSGTDLQYKAPVLGYLISEGNLCHPHGIYFYSSKDDEINDFIKYVSKFSNIKIKLNRSKSAISLYCGQQNQQKGNYLEKWITELGLKNKKATDKKLPDCVFSWPLKYQAILIGKMWQGDGCINLKGTQLYYATSSSLLAKDLQHLLLRFGIISVIHKKSFTYRGGMKTGFTLVISHRKNILKFAENIGHNLIGNKHTEMENLAQISSETVEIAARGTKDTIPKQVLSVIRSEMLLKDFSVSKVCHSTGLSERLFHFDNRKIGFEPTVVKKIATVLASETLSNIADSDVYWDEVVSVTEEGKEMTYDLTVPPNHNFVANDIIVHNSHAASYGKVAYQTSYMKANFPAIYMSSVLTADSGDVERIGETIQECKRMGIPVLPPSINESYSAFTVVKVDHNKSHDILSDKITPNSEPASGSNYLQNNQGGTTFNGASKIRFGLTTIKNFGEGISHAIIAERKKGGKFKSLGDFLSRVKDRNLNKKSLEALIKAGALDEFGERGRMLANMETLLAFSKESAGASKDQTSLFGGLADSHAHDEIRLEPAPPASPSETLGWEKELLGLYISGHPLDKFREILEKRDINIKKAKEEMKEGMIAVLGGIVEEIRPVITKKNDSMAFIKLADFTGSLEVVVFPKTYNEFKNILQPESCVVIKGRISHRNGEVSIVAEKVKQLVASVGQPTKPDIKNTEPPTAAQ